MGSCSSGGKSGATGAVHTDPEMENFISKYRVRIIGDKLGADNYITKHPEDAEYLRSHKQEIIDYIKSKEIAEKKRIEARKAKIQSIKGLKEIEAAESAWYRYDEQSSQFIYKGGYGKAPEKPSVTMNEMYKKYPRAAAYREAEKWENSSNYTKSAFGREAKEQIINGKSYKTAIAKMKKDWKEYTEKHLWD